MEKTKLLLAFGTHHNPQRGYDRRFFREAVVPFLEEEVVHDGRKAVIITELLGYDSLEASPKSIEEKKRIIYESGKRARQNRQKIQSQLTALERRTNKLWRETRENGQPFMKVTLDLGFEYKVLEINSYSNGQIANVVEPQTIESAYNSWRSDVLSEKVDRAFYGVREERLKALIRYTSQMIKFQVGRDKDVANLADSLRKENPDRAIIIPRGTVHKGMKVLFDERNYDITFREADYALDFTDELIMKSYRIFPSNKDVERYARLQSHYLDYVVSHFNIPSQILMRLFGFKHKAERQMEDEGRVYALRTFETEFGAPQTQ